MSHVFLQRQFPQPLNTALLIGMIADATGCFGLHRVTWVESFFSNDRRALFCHFSAPDAESVRIALRQLDTDMRIHWPGSIHNAPGCTEADILGANVIVHRSFPESVELDDLQALEEENAHCLESHRVRFKRTFLARDRRRMACLYEAPDAESVRITQRQAGMPFASIQAIQRLSPDML